MIQKPSGSAPKFTSGELNVYRDPADTARVCRVLRRTGRRVMLVPTMGALHDGHFALVRAARQVPGAVVVVSIFVNPAQFGAGEDFAAYPRNLDDDVVKLRGAGVEVVFAPAAETVYPTGVRTVVQAGPAGDDLEGAARPGHFSGVLTVVLKLLQIVAPDRVFFGEKDYQQLVLVRQMVADFNLPVRVVAVPTVRERDGLAMSSRNRYLDPAQRNAAAVLSAALAAGAHAAIRGAGVALAAAEGVLAAVSALEVEYLRIRNNDLGPPPERGPARLLVAARLGSTRLLDNIAVTIGVPPGPGDVSRSKQAALGSDTGFVPDLEIAQGAGLPSPRNGA